MPWTIRQRIFLLIILVTLVCSAIAGVTIATLYRTAVESERARLMAMTHAQAQLMEAIARFDERFSAHDHPDGAAGATLSQILDAHRHHTEFGRTGELTLARRENARIVWLLPLRHAQSGHPDSPITSRLAQPMRLALTGNSGTIIGRDYRGEMVLAAYRHVAPLGLGLVSKIDLEEIRAPFVRAGVLTGVIGLGVIALSRLLLFWIRQPIIERLEESEAYTRAILAHAADGIITADETGTIQTFNATAERIFLYPAADVIGKNLGMLMPAPDNEAHRGYIETYLKTGESRILGARRDVLARRRDGSTIPIALAVTDVTLRGRRLFIATVRDLTEEKRIERMLAAQYAVARILAGCTTIEEATPAILHAICTNLGWQLGVFWQVDETHDLLRCIEVWCHAPECYAEFIAATKEHTFARARGLPGRVWQSGQPCWIPDVVKDVNFPRGRVAAKENLHAAFAFPIQLRGAVYGVMEFFSFHIQEPDENLLQHMHALGTQVGQFIERLNAHQQIRDLARFPEENPYPVLRITHEGCVLYSNDPGKVFLASMARHPASASQWQAAIAEALRGGGMHQVDLYGPDCIFSATFVVVPEKGYLNVYAQDVTELRKTEDALRQHEEQLRQSQKLEAIGTLAGGIAHDFNNILTALIGFTELAMAQTPLTAPIAAHLREIMKANYRAKDLIQQILAFSRQSEGGKKPVRLQPIIEEALKLIRATFPSTITIEKALEADAGPVYADPTQIHQVVMNLATNAEHAMRGQPGTLKVKLDEITVDADTAALIPGLSMGSCVRLTMTDSGCGIAPEHVSRIFDPFFTTKAVGEGTGMGLSVTHGIVADHGGAIHVQSEVGKGTTFILYFPRTAELPHESVDDPRPLPRGEGLVFFIDDEPAIVEAATAMLEELGYRVRAFTNSQDALEAFRRDPHEIDVVITDQTMPERTGAELAQEFLRLRPTIPIILCTGFNHAIDEDKALAMGIRVFLRKPFLFHELAHAIQHALSTSAS